jgi:uncharacterized protein YaiI (UPF0178 family)
MSFEFKIYVDADSLPNAIKDILCRAGDRTKTNITFIANHPIYITPSKYLNFIQVTQGLDVADDEIIKRMNPNDLIISADIPLADEAIEKGGVVLTPRGEMIDKNNIKSKLSMRDFMTEIRNSGVETGGKSSFNQRDKQAFGNNLDKVLNSLKK